MHIPDFHTAEINLDCRTLNDHGKTVAYVSPQGYVDWLLTAPDDDGEILDAVRIEPHLCWVLGTKFNLHLPHLCEEQDEVAIEVTDGGTAAVFTGKSHSKDGRFTGRHSAEIRMDPETNRYCWRVRTTLTYSGTEPCELPWIEYTNVYPFGTGRCMLFAPVKRFDRTLLVDRDGTVWHFPHQHCMHYGRKISQLEFAEGSLGGFFGEDRNPVVIVEQSTLPPDWAICDMYYDLHCGSRPQGPIQPGAEHRWQYAIRCLDAEESRKFTAAARYVPVTADDYETFAMPRLALGQNDLGRPVVIDDVEDASGFRPDPPEKVWDREIGPPGKGALRLTNRTAKETVWSATPPSQIPSERKFNLSALVKTENVEGRGIYLRVRYHTFEWRPEPHVDWVQTLESEPVNGTADWVRIHVPELVVPEEHFDYLVWIDVVLEGSGTAWLTDVGVELQGIEADVPELAPA